MPLTLEGYFQGWGGGVKCGPPRKAQKLKLLGLVALGTAPGLSQRFRIKH